MNYKRGDIVILDGNLEAYLLKVSFNKKLALIEYEVWHGLETKWVKVIDLISKQIELNVS